MYVALPSWLPVTKDEASRGPRYSNWASSLHTEELELRIYILILLLGPRPSPHNGPTPGKRSPPTKHTDSERCTISNMEERNRLCKLSSITVCST
jgi:hypothetical protein